MTLIRPNTISFFAEITEDELRKRIADEVLTAVGAMGEDGKPLPGVKAEVRRGESRKGGYKITITGPAPARLLLPAKGDGQ
ncbi:hypothetical protein ACFO5X_07385 [Seohaeicola nanhaiensis]|uniref:HK97 gp10 family phage protein n=1 Tax=Seohaeicola nanhaiensis TaxID=1387282 RepID=A0ABV9KDX5_9RHOB